MNATIEDLSPTIVPKSDQLNADQLLGGPMTITVSGVKIGTTDEQPISIHYPNDDGRPYKPCKTMRKVLVLAWGADGRQWAGRSMMLYTDQSVRFGKDEVGGIRISHLTDIAADINVNLNATKGKKKLYEIKRMAAPAKAERPARTERHDSMIADFEVLARDQGFDAFKAAWERTPKEDRAAIGVSERNRIGALSTAAATKPHAATKPKSDAKPPAQAATIAADDDGVIDEDFVAAMERAERGAQT